MDEQPDKRTAGECPGNPTPAVAVASLGAPSICGARELTPAAERIAAERKFCTVSPSIWVR